MKVTKEMIDEATRHMRVENTHTPASTDSFTYLGFLRSAILSLAEFAAELHGLDSVLDAEEAIPGQSGGQDDGEGTERDAEVRTTLREMGFGPAAVHKAVQVAKGDLADAIQWLLAPERQQETGPQPNCEEDPNPMSPVANQRPRRRRIRFEPHREALRHLQEMGFDEESATEALRECANDHQAACGLLLGDHPRSSGSASAGGGDVVELLDRNSALWRLMMKDTHIVSSLLDMRLVHIFRAVSLNWNRLKYYVNADTEAAYFINRVLDLYRVLQ